MLCFLNLKPFHKNKENCNLLKKWEKDMMNVQNPSWMYQSSNCWYDEFIKMQCIHFFLEWFNWNDFWIRQDARLRKWQPRSREPHHDGWTWSSSSCGTCIGSRTLRFGTISYGSVDADHFNYIHVTNIIQNYKFWWNYQVLGTDSFFNWIPVSKYIDFKNFVSLSHFACSINIFIL